VEHASRPRHTCSYGLRLSILNRKATEIGLSGRRRRSAKIWPRSSPSLSSNAMNGCWARFSRDQSSSYCPAEAGIGSAVSWRQRRRTNIARSYLNV